MAQGNSGHGGREGGGPGVLRKAGRAAGTTGHAQEALGISFERDLRAHRGQLGFGPGPGELVFAASFLARREIVLEASLLSHAPDLVRVFAHEVYHFVWRRLGNVERASWSEVLRAEKRPRHAGLSSELRYQEYRDRESAAAWKNYVCEAFCDTAAAEGKISLRRKQWFRRLTQQRKLPV